MFSSYMWFDHLIALSPNNLDVSGWGAISSIACNGKEWLRNRVYRQLHRESIENMKCTFTECFSFTQITRIVYASMDCSLNNNMTCRYLNRRVGVLGALSVRDYADINLSDWAFHSSNLKILKYYSMTIHCIS